jgi:hypothetical protein
MKANIDTFLSLQNIWNCSNLSVFNEVDPEIQEYSDYIKLLYNQILDQIDKLSSIKRAINEGRFSTEPEMQEQFISPGGDLIPVEDSQYWTVLSKVNEQVDQGKHNQKILSEKLSRVVDNLLSKLSEESGNKIAVASIKEDLKDNLAMKKWVNLDFDGLTVYDFEVFE